MLHLSRRERRGAARRARKAARAAKAVTTMALDDEDFAEDCDCPVCRALASGGDGVAELGELVERAKAGDPSVIAIVGGPDGEEVFDGRARRRQ